MKKKRRKGGRHFKKGFKILIDEVEEEKGAGTLKKDSKF